MSTTFESMMEAAAKAVPERAVTELRSRIRGGLAFPGESAYHEARALWNGMIDRKPALIVRCLGVADVIAAVNFAREYELPLSIKGGGHNIAGLACCDGGVMLDMSLMKGVWVDTAARTARAQAGCLLGDLDRETQLHGLATVLGFVSATGIAGLTLGGGFGYLSRRFGWTSDNVLSMDVVTADGQFVRASETENADLFWGLRGGGGNFGVVTSIEYRLFPLGPDIVGGAIAWRAEEADGVLEMYQRRAEEWPPELALAMGHRLAPPAPWLPPDVHGKPIVLLAGLCTGSIAEGEKMLAPVKALGKPVGDIIQRRPYVVQQSLLDATQPKGRRYYWKSEYMPGVTADVLESCVLHARQLTSLHSAVLMFPINGAISDLPDDHSAVGNRNARIVLNIAAAWDKPEDDEANIRWARNTWQEMRRFSTGGTYINFLNADDGNDRTQAAYGANYQRLVDIKTRWDPANLLRINKNVQPQRGPA
jgi:FAD/FMN-containing dehydrogenase